MKWNLLYQITAASRTSWLGGYRPQIPVLSVLCPQLNLLHPPPPPTPKYSFPPFFPLSKFFFFCFCLTFPLPPLPCPQNNFVPPPPPPWTEFLGTPLVTSCNICIAVAVVKLPLYRPGQPLWVPGFRCHQNIQTIDTWRISALLYTPLPHRRYSRHSFSREAESTPGP